MAKIDPALLEQLLANNRSQVEAALEKANEGAKFQMSLQIIKVTSVGKPLHEAVIDYLSDLGRDETFISALEAEELSIRGSAPSQKQTLQAIRDAGFPNGLGKFEVLSNSFRCRIKVNGEVMGSGVLVSNRLVLTAWHVFNGPGLPPGDNPPRIEVITSDKQVLRARPTACQSPCHPSEQAGGGTNEDLSNHHDFALLRVSEPAGFRLRFVELDDLGDDRDATVASLLVHFPSGEDVGLTVGEATLESGVSRVSHTVLGAPGSSGGAVFSNSYDMIGVHQKRVGEGRVCVPVTAIRERHPCFDQMIETDLVPPTYLWSLNESVHGDIVIGRRSFFDGLDAMVDEGRPGNERLRGIWMRRLRPEEDQSGLGYAYEMLEAFLRRRQAETNYRLVRIALLAHKSDLFDMIEAAFDGATGVSNARAGVRENETTDVAFEADRADALVRHMEQRHEGPIWLYIDGPKQDLPEKRAKQLEQFLARVMRSEKIRFVITRLESYRLPVEEFESLADVSERRPPGVYLDYTGNFERNDVLATIEAAVRDLALDLAPAIIEDMTNLVLAGFEPQHRKYHASALGTVAARLKEKLLERVEGPQ